MSRTLNIQVILNYSDDMALLFIAAQGQINIYWYTWKVFSWMLPKKVWDINVYMKQNKNSAFIR